MKKALATRSPQEKRPLGQGLKALLGPEEQPKDIDKKAGAKENTNLKQAEIHTLIPGELQPRKNFNQVTLGELSQSITESGVLQPILVRTASKGKYEIIAGERRWRAAKTAGLKTVPIIIQEMDDKQVIQTGLIENIQRDNLDPIEEAAAYKRLMMEFSYTQEKLSTKLGKSRSHIANSLRLLTLPPGVQKLLREKKISAGHARALLTSTDPLQLANQVLREGLSVRQTEQLCTSPKKEFKEGSTKPQFQGQHKDADCQMLEEQISSLLGMKATVQSYGRGAGVINLHYASYKQLDDFMLTIQSKKKTRS